MTRKYCTSSPRPEKLYEVYMYECRVNGKKYVGKTVYNAKWRDDQHCKIKNPQCPIDRAIKKYGRENFVLTVIYRGSSNEEICMVERALIAERNSFMPAGYNLTIGGEGRAGYKHSDESKKKMSDARRGKKLNPEHVANIVRALIGRVHTEETKQKMSTSNPRVWLGETFTPEHRSNIALGGTGRIFSDESRIKKSASLRAWYAENPKPKIKESWECWHYIQRTNPWIICKETGNLFKGWKSIDSWIGTSIGYARKMMDRHGIARGFTFTPLSKIAYERFPL